MGMIPELEELYPEGSDITIMNTYYNFPLYLLIYHIDT